MTFEPAAHLLAFVLPISFRKGDVTFVAIRTSERVSIPITANSRSRHVVSTAQLTKGVWRVGLHWSDGYTQYQEDKEIVIV